MVWYVLCGRLSQSRISRRVGCLRSLQLVKFFLGPNCSFKRFPSRIQDNNGSYCLAITVTTSELPSNHETENEKSEKEVHIYIDILEKGDLCQLNSPEEVFMCSLEKACLVSSLMQCLIEFERLEKCLGICNSNDCECLPLQTIKIYLPHPSQKFGRECKGETGGSAQIKAAVYEFQNERERKLTGKKLIFLLVKSCCQAHSLPNLSIPKKDKMGKYFIRNMCCRRIIVPPH